MKIMLLYHRIKSVATCTLLRRKELCGHLMKRICYPDRYLRNVHLYYGKFLDTGK
jgi:hypothetical protein